MCQENVKSFFNSLFFLKYRITVKHAFENFTRSIIVVVLSKLIFPFRYTIGSGFPEFDIV